ncbi:uncharacterized protein LOC116215426 [Punica granatum]|uniref:Uncharacterized protein n=2 Tax=Punica granatum TaxID=22663 RepID=A0A218VS11_PUNGR|nr:uncharacterized protein LOC116215426 [Punica granatum]OWM62870.1 hypothetical protein CDL15_Pgr020164 [Punica granatum]PKI48141.1 hypothetical protein CRG98_031406 [Punica granatum]
MGGNNNHRQAKSKVISGSISLFGFLKHWRQHRRDDQGLEDVMSPRKVWPSDYDRGNYVAEPGIDRRASAFIARFHESRVSESECHAINA